MGKDCTESLHDWRNQAISRFEPQSGVLSVIEILQQLGLAGITKVQVASKDGAMAFNSGVELGCRMAGDASARLPAQLADDGC